MGPSTVWILPPLGTVKMFWKDLCFKSGMQEAKQPLQQL